MNTEVILTQKEVIIRTPVALGIFSEARISYDKFSKLKLTGAIESATPNFIYNGESCPKLEFSSFRIEEKSMSSIVSQGSKFEVTLNNYSIKYHLIYIRNHRELFPSYKKPFLLETDNGSVTTHVTSASTGTSGNPNAGQYIQHNLSKWYKAHPNLKPGDKVVIEVLEPFKRYRLMIGV